MFGIGRHGPDGKYAVILDIGSASVGVAIVASDLVTEENPVIYSQRHSALVKQVDTDRPTRFIEEALLETFLTLGSTGIKTLREYDSHARISYICVTVSAPWSYTVTQEAVYEAKEPFVISPELLESLIHTARTEALKNDRTLQFLADEGLEIIVNKVLYITVNGYAITNPLGLEASKIFVSHSSGIAPTSLMSTVKEHQEKVIPETILLGNTFMLSLYTGVRDLFPTVTDTCLVDLTNEATEVGVVRGGELKKTSHVHVGTHTIARMISEKLKMPQQDVLHILTSTSLTFTEKEQIVVDSALEEYVDTTASLFASLGDILTVPKILMVHADAAFEACMTPLLQKAAQRATKGSHTVYPLTSTILEEFTIDDTALALSSYLFHKQHGTNTLTES